MRVAVDRGLRDGAGFFDITAFGRTAETCAEFLSRGRRVGVSGRLRHSEWTADDGSKRSRVEIIADRVQFLGSRRDAQPPASQNDSEPVSEWAPDHEIDF